MIRNEICIYKSCFVCRIIITQWLVSICVLTHWDMTLFQSSSAVQLLLMGSKF